MASRSVRSMPCWRSGSRWFTARSGFSICTTARPRAIGAYGIFYLRSGRGAGPGCIRSMIRSSTSCSPWSRRASHSGPCESSTVVGCVSESDPGARWVSRRWSPAGWAPTWAWCSPGPVTSTFSSHRRLVWPPPVVFAWILGRAAARVATRVTQSGVPVAAAITGAAIGVVCGVALANAGGSRLYLSWAVSCLLAGMVGLAFYRGLYVQIIRRTNSRLIMLVASLGILLALTALTIIVFESAPRPLPDVFGSTPWQVGGRDDQGLQCLRDRYLDRWVHRIVAVAKEDRVRQVGASDRRR